MKNEKFKTFILDRIPEKLLSPIENLPTASCHLPDEVRANFILPLLNISPGINQLPRFHIGISIKRRKPDTIVVHSGSQPMIIETRFPANWLSGES